MNLTDHQAKYFAYELTRRYQALVDEWAEYDNSGNEPRLVNWMGKP